MKKGRSSPLKVESGQESNATRDITFSPKLRIGTENSVLCERPCWPNTVTEAKYICNATDSGSSNEDGG